MTTRHSWHGDAFGLLAALVTLLAFATAAHAYSPLPFRQLVRLQETLAPGSPSNVPTYEKSMREPSVKVQPKDTALTAWAVKPGPGVQKILYIEDDMRWATVHVNTDEERDIVKLEERLLNLSPETLQAKGDLSVDEYRMAMNKGKELEQ